MKFTGIIAAVVVCIALFQCDLTTAQTTSCPAVSGCGDGFFQLMHTLTGGIHDVVCIVLNTELLINCQARKLCCQASQTCMSTCGNTFEDCMSELFSCINDPAQNQPGLLGLFYPLLCPVIEGLQNTVASIQPLMCATYQFLQYGQCGVAR
jgi:hypothetical protein